VSLISRPIQNERGIAMILAVFAMVLTIVIATEVAYETSVEYVAAANSLNRLKAYYAAKSGVELSLFRILLYKKAIATYGDQLKEKKSMLDPIWQFPMSWPPLGLDNLNAADKDNIAKIVKESTLDTQYTAVIEGEGGKIDINDLGSDIKTVSDGVRSQILQIFTSELENNKAFKNKYENFDFEELVNNIQDWVDEDNVSLNKSGDESLNYKLPDNAGNVTLPPNAPFKTLSELHMVHKMEDQFFNLLKDRVTVYGTKGINVNYAREEVLKSIDAQIKDEVLKKVLERRNDPKKGGPFLDEADFFNFLEGQGVRTDNLKKSKIPLLFDAEYNFRIISTGLSTNIKREITAVTYDIDNLTSRYAEILTTAENDKAAAAGGGTGSGTSGGGTSGGSGGATPSPTKDKIKIPKGRPTVVFWQET
jgi:general secretion pathway protein K